MDIIMTHEQTDFDGFASMLGAYLLNDRAHPLLPSTLNRNVQQFFNTYHSELPFISPQALPKQNIRSVTLVDTQSMITLKGITKDTQVSVIDHHKKKEDFNPTWNFTPVNCGACSTYFVEQLIEHNGNLSIIHATLLLLGIYEDTGSLTYANTTANDAQAVAFLLSQGASLKIASEYLNLSLSNGQQKVFDALIKNHQIVERKKQRIMVSYADAEFLEEEVSSIAHKLCDLYDPDALFIFVHTKEGVRFVARSTSDQINVAAIAARYEGGGHPRAAAALIRDAKKGLIALKQEFIDTLDEFVHPSITVKQIMSTNPLLLDPGITAQEALQFMQRFGYEGFPVVENEKVIGLLTRRAVDRAIAHQMNLPAKSLMEAGNYYVYPETSLEELHHLMARANWGQVPVVHRQTGKIIGIVTRTDLLQAYSGFQVPLSNQLNLAAQLEENMDAGQLELMKIIASAAHELKMHVYLVGGVVRDILLNSPIYDLDFVVEGNAIELAHRLTELFGGKVTSHRQFGTAKWFLENTKMPTAAAGAQTAELPKSVDLISARTEFYKNPSALPTVKLSSIKLDLLRRDFTINTLAVQLDGKHYGVLSDYWGGLDDLKNGIIRVLHSLSFVDDPTRMLRAVRFEQRFGFQIEERTLELLTEAKPLLKQVSGDRIRHEIDLILEERLSVDIFQRLGQLGLLRSIHPDFSLSEKVTQLLQMALQAEPSQNWQLPIKIANYPVERIVQYCILFGSFPDEVRDKISARLKLPALFQKSILQAHTLIERLPVLCNQKPSQIYSNLREIPHYVLYAVHFFFHERDDILQILEQYLAVWSKIKPHSTGKSLQDRGISPGPVYKQIFQQLVDAWVDGKIRSSAEEEQLLDSILTTLTRTGKVPDESSSQQ
ncbi:MAG TPA: CBS domain-containing protein [Anaerolineaceae bacterium]|nr:CBS domain-containing protein [Anaerolineaceae bacterium]